MRVQNNISLRLDREIVFLGARFVDIPALEGIALFCRGRIIRERVARFHIILFEDLAVAYVRYGIFHVGIDVAAAQNAHVQFGDSDDGIGFFGGRIMRGRSYHKIAFARVERRRQRICFDRRFLEHVRFPDFE